MRIALICQDDRAAREILPAWMATFGELAAIVVIEEPRGAVLRRVRTEWRRSRWRLLDVLAFRAYYRGRFARRDSRLLAARENALAARYGAPPGDVPTLRVRHPNTPEVRDFLAAARPDVVLARCKTLLVRDIFEVPAHGTVVVHPGICPEYRNAHGCFWALARGDISRVGATMLRIDAGVDTGPVLGYYRAEFDALRDTHVAIQHAVVFQNLDRIADDLSKLAAGELAAIDTSGRASRAWGQPRLSDWIRWKRAARRGFRRTEASSRGGVA